MEPFAELGIALRALRRQAGLSQAELCRAANVSQTRLSAYEHGRGYPPLPVLGRLLETLGRSVQDLAGALLTAQGQGAPIGVAHPPLRPGLEDDVAQGALDASRSALERFRRGTTWELAVQAKMDAIEQELREEALRRLTTMPNGEEDQ